MPPHLAYVATLPCEPLMSPTQGINDKFFSLEHSAMNVYYSGY